MRWPLRALWLLTAAAVAGCGSSAGTSATLNIIPVERAIAESILTEKHIYTLVSCPAATPEQAGLSFTCQARLTVGTYPIYVRETNSLGHVRYGNQAALTTLDIASIDSAIGATLSGRGLHAVVVCPAEVLQQRGLSFTCTAKAAGRRYSFAVVETDGRGHVRYAER